MVSESTEQPGVVKLNSQNELRSGKLWPPCMFDYTEGVETIMTWVDQLSKGLSSTLAITLTPKSGKTSFLLRVAVPLIYTRYADKDPCVVVISFTDLEYEHEATRPLHNEFLQSLCAALEKALVPFHVALLPLPTDGAQRLRAIFAAAEQDSRPIYFLMDEFQRIAQFHDKTMITNIIGILKGATSRANLYFALSGSGMVLVMSAIRMSNANGRRFISCSSTVPLDKLLSDGQALWVAQVLVKTFRQDFDVPSWCSLDAHKLVHKTRALGELRPSLMAWFLNELPMRNAPAYDLTTLLLELDSAQMQTPPSLRQIEDQPTPYHSHHPSKLTFPIYLS
jgi:hypothetical protein